jgi:hypothetical protein
VRGGTEQDFDVGNDPVFDTLMNVINRRHWFVRLVNSMIAENKSVRSKLSYSCNLLNTEQSPEIVKETPTNPMKDRVTRTD